ncbi:hypothetical protein BHYA_0161g00260 [Botrytis hyacinthi]|uniref:Uncharacterized protein n=1 Tax=Botrytis hyacinthi TaxID=278943 RepID=A0A4Z1GP02_9HELO|nr:hypothetical protein BHYA_0161g00260 [Botrytis hyacinthi]
MSNVWAAVIPRVMGDRRQFENLTTVALGYYDKRDWYHQKSHCNDNREAQKASVTKIRDQVLSFTAVWSVLRRTLVTLYGMKFEPLPKLEKPSFVHCAGTAGSHVPVYKKEKRISGVTTPGIVKPA